MEKRGETDGVERQMTRTLKRGGQIGNAGLREDAGQADKARAGRPAPEIRYCGEMFAACIPLGPRLIS
jgi:hypothetical protein